MFRLPLEVQTLYAELLEQVSAYEAERAIGHLSGGFGIKTVAGTDYYYFQHSDPGGIQVQTYVGKRDAALDAVVAGYEDSRAQIAGDEESIKRLAALLRAGGAATADPPSARVLKALAEAGVFRLGGVLVGTHAFGVIGNLLGVRWDGALQTQDMDVAVETRLSVVVPELKADVPEVLERLKMGFLPVPAMTRGRASTSFKVRKESLRLDLLTPTKRPKSTPVAIPRFGTAALPLQYLDYVLEGAVAAALIGGTATQVNVPDPARFALHKLIVAGERPVAETTKRQKDLRQAAQVLAVLSDDRPGDIRLAWEAVVSRGGGWTKRVRKGVAAMAAIDADVAEKIGAMLG